METVLELKNLSYSYLTPKGEIWALSNISFSLKQGEFISIVGPSGCGKSTLLSIISGILAPQSGSIFVKPGISMGYMLQKDSLLEWRTVYKNIILGLEIQKKLTPSYLEYVDKMIEDYGLLQFRNVKPSQLSGGMKQRAALIRTLALKPDVLLLDEPFSALDYQTRLEVSNDIGNIIRSQKKTAILVTHDIAEAISMGDRVLVLSSRPASIKNCIDVNVSMDSRTPFNTRFAPEFKDIFNQIWKELT